MMSAALKKAAAAASKGGKGGKGSNANGKAAQLLAMQAMMEQMFGGSVPTLRKIIGDERVPSVTAQTTVREASLVMAKLRKGVLVMRGKELVGILTPKDLLNRVVAKGLSADETLVVSSVCVCVYVCVCVCMIECIDVLMY